MDNWPAAAGWVVAFVMGALWAMREHYHAGRERLLAQYRISREYWRAKWHKRNEAAPVKDDAR